ncbi:MAG: cupin domain-containing protein [Acidobacteria bacterium]|nr:cupin domain-containing protein [Acidobacteriota bacterium]
MTHPSVIRPADHAVFSADRMGKATLFASPNVLVGINAFEPGQRHALHAHPGQDKVYIVAEGQGLFLVEGAEWPMTAGDLLVAPADVAHGVANTSTERLVVVAILTPAPTSHR